MDQIINNYKAGGIIVKDKKVLVTRAFDEDIYLAPGGGVEVGETPQQTLIREMQEELTIVVDEEQLEEFGVFVHPNATKPHQILQMNVYLIKEYQGEIVPNNEIEEIGWVNSQTAPTFKIGSIFKEEVIPRLKQRGLIS